MVFLTPFWKLPLVLAGQFFQCISSLTTSLPSLSLYIPYLVLLTAMCMAKNGRQMMSHLPLKATLLLHTVVHLLSQCTLEVDFAQEKFKNISFF